MLPPWWTSGTDCPACQESLGSRCLGTSHHRGPCPETTANSQIAYQALCLLGHPWSWHWTLVGLDPQPSSSGCCQSSLLRASLTPSHLSPRPRFTVPPLALTFLISNEDLHQECGEGFDGALCHGVAPGVWNPDRRPRGLCSPSAPAVYRSPDCSSFGFCAPFPAGSGECGIYGRFGGPQHGDHDPGDGGGRPRSRTSLRRQSQHATSGLLSRCVAVPLRVRPCPRLRERPVFLSRFPSDTAFVDYPSREDVSMDFGGDFRTSPLLLCGRGRSSLGVPSEASRCPSSQASPEEEGLHGVACRSDLSFVSVSPGHHRTAPASPCQAGFLRDGPPDVTPSSGHAAPPKPFSSGGDTPQALSAFAKRIGSAPRTKASPMPKGVPPMPQGVFQDEPTGPISELEIAAPEMPVNINAAILQQSQAMNALVAHLVNQDIDLSASSSQNPLSMRGASKREKLQSELASRSGNFFLQVSQNAMKRIRPTDPLPTKLEEFPQKAIFSKYLERQGGYAQCKDVGLTMWMIAQIADAMLQKDYKGAQELLALTMVTLEQVAQDGGKWEVAYVLSLQQDPPQTLFTSRSAIANPRLKAFAPLCPQGWATTALSYLKELDVITQKRSEASKPTRDKSQEEEKPAPKKKQRFPKKPREENSWAGRDALQEVFCPSMPPAVRVKPPAYVPSPELARLLLLPSGLHLHGSRFNPSVFQDGALRFVPECLHLAPSLVPFSKEASKSPGWLRSLQSCCFPCLCRIQVLLTPCLPGLIPQTKEDSAMPSFACCRDGPQLHPFRLWVP